VSAEAQKARTALEKQGYSVTSSVELNDKDCELHKQGVEGDIPPSIGLVLKEYHRATGTHPRFNSAHEGFAIMKEEVDELWDEVKRKDHARSGPAMKLEAVQIAAMALRFIEECCGDEG
jgi:hypothetical protein